MKRSVFILLILLFPLFSAASIEMNPSYSQGETIIATVYGNFYDTIQESNIYFYRGHVKIPMDYDVAKIGDSFYIRASLIGKTENNYSVVIKDVRYYEGGILKNNPVTKNFTVTNQNAKFAVNKGFVISQNNFSIEAQNLGDSTLSLSVTKPSVIKSSNSVQISPNQIKSILFDVSEVNGTVEDTIKISTSDLSYEIPMYISHVIPTVPEPVQEYCGDGIKNGNEQCDGNNFGSYSSCSSFGFNSGTLSCNPPGSSNECTIDNSNCYNASSVECDYDYECSQGEVCMNNNCVSFPQNQSVCGNGVREGYEHCDGNDFGSIDGCEFFDYDSGNLDCTALCKINVSGCYDRQSGECAYDSQCDAGEVCEKGKCVSLVEKDCTYSWQCDDDETCNHGKCLEEGECLSRADCDEEEMCVHNKCIECEDSDDCNNGYTCSRSICVKKDCSASNPCAIGKACINDICVLSTGNECTRDSQCDPNDEICSNGNCVAKGDSPDSNQVKLCSDFGGVFCSSDQTCEGESREVSGSDCCLGGSSSCKDNPSNSTGKYFGWGLLAVLVIFVIWFFAFKSRRTRPRNLPF